MSAAEDDFYVICTSDSSMNFFPENTLANFTQKLNTPRQLVGEYEVGLCEVQFPHSWHNVRKSYNHFHMRLRMENNSDDTRGKVISDVKYVEPGRYKSVEDVFEAIKKAVTDEDGIVWLHDIEMRYDSVKHRTTFNTMGKKKDENGNTIPSRRSMKLGPDLAAILGFSSGGIIKADRIITSPFASLPIGGFFNIFIYCDVIAPIAIGDVDAPCLRVLPAQSKADNVIIAKSFSTVYYYPVAKKVINTINIKIADSSGILIGFDYGKVVAQLHFRRRR